MNDHASIYLLVTILALMVVLLIFGMKYFSAARSARLRIISEDAYRDLAARSIKAQEECASAMPAIREAIAEIESRLVNIEKVLREVE